MAAEKLSVILELVSGQYKREAREAAAATSQIGGAAKTASTSVNSMVGSMRAFAGAAVAGAVIKFGADSVKAATNLEESMNAVKVVFGEASATITAFGETAAETAGLAQADFQQMATTLGSALINAGMSADEAAKKTIELTQRAADMASVFNTSVPEALGAMQAALRGESDPIEKFGVTLSEAAVTAEAAALGFSKVGGQFDSQAKAAARLSLIMKQTDRVQGDFANTSGGLANKTKELQAKFTNLQAQVGTLLLPVLADLADGIVDIVDAAEPLVDVLGVLTDMYTGLKSGIDDLQDSDNAFLKFLGDAGDALIGFGGGLGAALKGFQAFQEAFGPALPKMVGFKGVLDEVHDSWTSFNGVAFDSIDLINRQGTAFSNAASAADSQREALIKLADFQRSQLSPISNIIRLQQELTTAQEALAAAQEDGETPADELALAQLQVADALLALQAAGLALTPDQIQAFSQLLITEFNMTEQQVLETLEALNLLDGWEGMATFTLQMNTIASGGGGGGNINTDILGFAQGTSRVPGWTGQPQLVLAHGGETITPAGQQGNTSNRFGGNIIVMSPSNNLALDLQYGALLANHQTFGKF